MKNDRPAHLKKGARVWLIQRWNNAGAFSYQSFVVRSAGSKQVHLIADDGTNLEHRLYRGNYENSADVVTFPIEIDPRAKALELSAAWIPAELAHIDARMSNPAYNQEALKERRASILTTPAAVDRKAEIEQIRANAKARAEAAHAEAVARNARV